MPRLVRRFYVVLLLMLPIAPLHANEADTALDAYFRAETKAISADAVDQIPTASAWQQKRQVYRQELLEMLGLDPLPERTPLQAVVTGTLQRDDIVVENLHFQSLPGLYVTGNLYRPATVDAKLPAILYVCGHGGVKRDGVSYGNKTHYQHHGIWFARHGYVCLTIDTIQLGELEGIHHGTYRENMWWWLNRGYTPAGVEAWNSTRAIDYLLSRDEVDSQRLGITGRSGGGAYSWWTAAIDERIQVVVPVAGITDLHNHIVDGTVEGHCDCMFMVNLHRWNFDKLAALIAPRALLVSNTDRDPIFPLDGVYRTYSQVRHVYELLGVPEKVALHVTAGPHQDTQELRIHAFRWFNQHLRSDEQLIREPAEKLFTPQELKVFRTLPTDQRTTVIHETFVPKAEPEAFHSVEDRRRLDARLALVQEKMTQGWPQDRTPLQLRLAVTVTAGPLRGRAFDFESQPHVPLRAFVIDRDGVETTKGRLTLLDQTQWEQLVGNEELSASEQTERLLESVSSTPLPPPDTAVVLFSPRGLGPLKWSATERKRTQLRRRFYLLGQSLDGMRLFDICRLLDSLQSAPELRGIPWSLSGRGHLGALGLYASLRLPVNTVFLDAPPATEYDDPHLLGCQRFFDFTLVPTLAASRSRVELRRATGDRWAWVRKNVQRLGWEDRLRFLAD